MKKILIRTRWGYTCYVAGVSKAQNGVAILFNNTFTYKVHKIIKDEEHGSFIILDISIFNERYTLVNLYGPSEKDSPDFFRKLFEKVELIGNRQVITAGDWNVIPNPRIDARNYITSNPRPNSRKKIEEIKENLELVDIFRMVYPSKRQYTWRKFNTIKQSRLDYFLISDCLITSVKDIKITPGYRSDHSIVVLSIKQDLLERKPRTYWKFNNSLLNDIKYVEKVKHVILETIKQYAIPIYNYENILDIPKNEIQFVINEQLFFEILLVEIRGSTVAYASYKKKIEEKAEKELIDQIKVLEEQENISEEDMMELEQKKILLQEYREKK